MSLVEMALGRYPIPQPPAEEIDSEMQQPPAGTLPPRQGGNPYASHAHAIRMPIFELLQIIFSSVSVWCDLWAWQGVCGVTCVCVCVRVWRREDLVTH